MALDIGQARIGIAVSDPGERVASPVCVLPAAEVLGNAKPFRRVLEDWEPELLLCGLPRSLSGEEGPQAGARAGGGEAHRAGLRPAFGVCRRAFELPGGQTEFA